jgi:predicted nucleic acid-binding protein
LEHGLGVVTRNTADFERTGLHLLNPWLPITA